jgi:hypothetical protein
MTIEQELFVEQERRVAVGLDREELEERYLFLIRSMIEKENALKDLMKTLLLGDIPGLPH